MSINEIKFTKSKPGNIGLGRGATIEVEDGEEVRIVLGNGTEIGISSLSVPGQKYHHHVVVWKRLPGNHSDVLDSWTIRTDK